MTSIKTFKDLFEEHLVDLELYVPVVAKVHGTEHPEFLKVKEIYDELMKKIEVKGLESIDQVDLKEEFAKLRKITNAYKIPEDTCETYEAVYDMLGQLDKAYEVIKG